MPKVSVILSSYNHAKFICESIENTLKQTFTDFELIIWDDGSSDNSWELIQRYSDPRIRAFRNEKNIGGVFGVNKAISEVATGEFIAIHHSDDVWELDKLQKQVDCLAANPQMGAVFTNAQPVDERGQPLADKEHFYYNVFNQPNRTRKEWLRHFFFRGNALCHPSILIRKQCYQECGLYLDSLAQLTDFDMWVRLCLKYEIHVLTERLVRFRVRDAEMNASGNRPEVRIRDRSEFHYVLKHFLRIGTFEELVAIFPEVEKYHRQSGCVPQFVFAMAALGDTAMLWAKMLGIETLFDLLADPDTKERIKSLYQFTYRDFTALTGQHDLFCLETVVNQRAELAERDVVIAKQTEQIAQLARSARTGKSAVRQAASRTYANKGEISADRSAYEKAARLLEAGQAAEGKALLEALAEKGNSCWDVYNDLGVQYFNEGELAKATACFEHGLRLEGNAGTTARNYASMRLAAGDVDGALATWGVILHEQPQDEAVLEIVREVLSNITPIPQSAWQRLVADIAGGRDEIDGNPDSAAVDQEKEIKIFQIYYDENTRLLVDPSFIPLDNTENARPDWCEYWSIRKILLNQSFSDDTYLGFFSPRFFEKTAMSGSQVLEAVRNSSADVISFSPYFDQGALHPSPFYHGESHHHGLLNTAQNVLVMLNVNLDLNALICDQTTTIFSNYFVARYSFWKKWFAYAEKIFNVCEGPDCELKSSLVDLTQHRNSNSYAMKVFILERLVTIVMAEQHIRSEVAIDVRKAPLSFPQSRAILDKLMVCDALKSQFLETGLSPFVETYVMYRNKLLESKLT